MTRLLVSPTGQTSLNRPPGGLAAAPNACGSTGGHYTSAPEGGQALQQHGALALRERREGLLHERRPGWVEFLQQEAGGFRRTALRQRLDQPTQRPAGFFPHRGSRPMQRAKQARQIEEILVLGGGPQSQQ